METFRLNDKEFFCPVELTLHAIGGKWKVLILWNLRSGLKRYGELRKIVSLGAEAAVGDLGDTAFLTNAFRGATAVYALTPPNPTAPDFRAFQQQIGRSLVTAIREAGVRNVMFLSSQGAHLPAGAGVVQGLHDVESYLQELEGVNVRILRPAYFMENLWTQLDTIKGMGITGSPLRPDLRFPVVHTRDIAEVAAQELLALNFRGTTVRDVLGPKDVTYTEIAGVLGKAIGRNELPYVQFPRPDAKAAMLGYGLSESYVEGLLDFCEVMNNGQVMSLYQRTPEGTTPTSIEEFAQQFAAAYREQPQPVQ